MMRARRINAIMPTMAIPTMAPIDKTEWLVLLLVLVLWVLALFPVAVPVVPAPALLLAAATLVVEDAKLPKFVDGAAAVATVEVAPPLPSAPVTEPSTRMSLGMAAQESEVAVADAPRLADRR